MSNKNRSTHNRRTLAALAIAVLAASSTSAFAQTASGNAYDTNIHLTVAGFLHFDIDPIRPVQAGPQTGAYSVEDSLNDWSYGNDIASASIGSLHSSVQWDPGDGQFAGGAETTEANFSLDAVSLLSDSVLSISADEIHSMVLVSGYCSEQAAATPSHPAPRPTDLGDIISNMLYDNGFDSAALKPVTEAEMPGLEISILGTALPGLPSDPPPNTTIDLSTLGLVGATLVLNEQNRSGDGIHSLTMSMNALRMNFDAAGILTADVTVGHTDTTVSCTQ